MNLGAVAKQQREGEFLLGFQVLRQVALFAHRAFDARNWNLVPNSWGIAALKDLRSLAVAAPTLFEEIRHFQAYVDFRRSFELGEFRIRRKSSRLQRQARRRLGPR